MKYKLKNGEEISFLEIEELKTKKNLYVSVSGGTDSSLVLYLTAKEISENLGSEYQIFPMMAKDVNRANGEKEINIIIDYVKKTFPDVKINDLFVKPLDKTKGTIKFKLYDISNEVKDKKHSMVITGLSKNIDIISAEATKVHKRKNGGKIKNYESLIPDLLFYRPLANHNKFDVAELYKRFDLLESIFPYTISCINPVPLDSKNPCGKCYWCQEKFLAFGSLDIVR